MNKELIRQPPEYCEYAAGSCDQSFDSVKLSRGLILYPSEPAQIASTIETAASQLTASDGENQWMTWKELHSTGQIIYCSICKGMRFTDFVVVDVTTLNFNLLFEIGYALGLELPVIPIRDTSFVKDKVAFDELGLLDTIGYTDFQNSKQLAERIQAKLPVESIPAPEVEINIASPLYVLKGHLETEGEVRLLSALKKSALRFRTYDIVETPRLSLNELRKQVATSLGVIAHLLSPDRKGALVHNARCAFTAGLTMAAGKSVLMLQEGKIEQPIDYRDVVAHYLRPEQVPKLISKIVLQIITSLQNTKLRELKPPKGLLQKLDIGDVAAENEIRALSSYFVETGQFIQAKRGYARLVVGRKGTGKTAIFYAVRNSLGRGHSRIVLDLKPEGHQFTKLRDLILSKLNPGLQEHTLTAFWNFILLVELAHKINETDFSWAQRDPKRQKLFQAVVNLYENCGYAESGDFSERLLNQVERLVNQYKEDPQEITAPRITEILFSRDIKQLDNAVGEYLEEKDEVWVLVDNLDKGWPTRGASSLDILIIRTLLEATRKLQRQLERREVNFNSLLFLRNDIYDHLVRETPDKGKDTAITLDWSDSEVFKEIFSKRVEASGVLEGSFDNIWASVFESHVRTRDSFLFILDRTLMRPRDFLTFLHRAIEVAINRGHNRILQDDILQAELSYSEDMLKTVLFELKDIKVKIPDFLYDLIGCNVVLSRDEIAELLSKLGVTEKRIEYSIELLLWFGFLGVKRKGIDEEQYAYQVRYDMAKLLAPVRKNQADFVVHPAFRAALDCVE